MAEVVDLVDAVAADLNALALPTHRTWKYLEPPTLRMDLGPILAVYPKVTEFVPIGTPEPAYEDSDVLRLDWFQPTLVSVETGGTASETNAKDGLTARDLIVDRVRVAYGQAIPGLAGQSEGTLLSAEYGIVDGGTAWLCRVEVRVVRWS